MNIIRKWAEQTIEALYTHTMKVHWYICRLLLLKANSTRDQLRPLSCPDSLTYPICSPEQPHIPKPFSPLPISCRNQEKREKFRTWLATNLFLKFHFYIVRSKTDGCSTSFSSQVSNKKECFELSINLVKSPVQIH